MKEIINEKSMLRIGELAKLTNVNVKSLRYYEKIGALRPDYIAPSGYRYYSPSKMSLVDAIQLCVDLDIPIKNFNSYYDDKTGELRFDQIFDDGFTHAQAKFSEIKRRLKRLHHVSEDIKRCSRLDTTSNTMLFNMNSTTLWLQPYHLYDNISDYLRESYHELNNLLTRHGSFAQYDYGRILIIHHDFEKLFRYITIEDNALDAIDTSASTLPVLKLPSGTYDCKVVPQNSIFEYERIFPEAIGKDRIIIEAKLRTGNFNIINPKYELRCKVMDFDKSLITKLKKF